MREAGEVETLGTILGVWAHPDDEAYLSAGLMAAATAAGARVVVATATLGEAGSPDGTVPPEQMAVLRRSELERALAAVGVDDLRVLGVPDGGCDAIAPGDGARWVAGLLDEVRPDTIVTFGPDGMTAHPDHVAVGRWATLAWEASGHPGRLLRATKTPGFATWFADFHETYGIFPPGLPVTVEPEDLAVLLDVTGPLLERKRAALAAHHSQTAELARLAGEDTYRDWIREEAFVAAPVDGVRAAHDVSGPGKVRGSRRPDDASRAHPRPPSRAPRTRSPHVGAR